MAEDMRQVLGEGPNILIKLPDGVQLVSFEVKTGMDGDRWLIVEFSESLRLVICGDEVTIGAMTLERVNV